MKNPLSFHAGRGKNAVGVLEPLPIIGFSQLSDMEFFVDPKNEMSETEIHPLCGWE